MNSGVRGLVSDVVQDLALGATPCIVGDKGCGKSAVVAQLSHMLGYGGSTTSIHLYKDMGARDLLVRRTTSEAGDSMWELSPLLKAAVSGGLVVLDGVHRLSRETLSALAPLVHDGMLSLPQGGQVMTARRFGQLVESSGLTPDELARRGVLRIDPSFRLLALAAPPASKANWLTAETASLFSFHEFPPTSDEDISAILHAVCRDVSSEIIAGVLGVAKVVNTLKDDAALQGALSVSLRQIIRMTRRMSAFPQGDLLQLLHRTCMTSFLPSQVRNAFDDRVNQVIPARKEQVAKDRTPLKISVGGGAVDIGGTTLKMRVPKNQAKVPKVEFYDIDQHVKVLQEICRDFVAGERCCYNSVRFVANALGGSLTSEACVSPSRRHILLIGNQGVGKNKIADRLCDLLQYERCAPLLAIFVPGWL